MTCSLDKTAQQDAWEAFEIVEFTKDMENSFKSFTLTRSSISGTLKSRKSIASSSVDSGLENEYTQVQNGLADVHPSMWLKIKYPIEADDASPNGMLSQSDFDAVLQGIQQVCVRACFYSPVVVLSETSIVKNYFNCFNHACVKKKLLAIAKNLTNLLYSPITGVH